jgi:hypothetical protein
MGNGTSAPQYPVGFQSMSADNYLQLNGLQDNDDKDAMPLPLSNSDMVLNKRYLKTPFEGIWSVYHVSGPSPEPRTGFFSVYVPHRDKFYIGYGISKQNDLFNDVWCFDFSIRRWMQIPLNGETVSPRCGTRATLVGDHIACFGGYANHQYFGDFHIINLANGQVSRPPLTGIPPSPRSSCLVTSYNNQFLYVWAGFNGEWPTELNILNLQTKEWTQKESSVSQRTAFSYVNTSKNVYCFGGASSGALVQMDPETQTMIIVKPKNNEPSSKVMHSSMVAVENYLIVIGGKIKEEYQYIYCFNILSQKWSIFHVLPDDITVTYADGDMSENRLFKMPTCHSMGTTYRHQDRSIYGFLGEPSTDSSVFLLDIGPALSVLHMTDDMLAMLSMK